MTALPCPVPIVAAPMAGGPSTPALAAAVSDAGGLGFLAAGNLTAEALDAQLTEVERLTERPYGINLFLPTPASEDPGALRRYAAQLASEAAALGVDLGEPRWDDDALDAKLDVVARHRPALVSFTFDRPGRTTVERIRAATGATIVGTVTSSEEATMAAADGVDLLVVQGAEAGGHRGIFRPRADHPAGGDPVPLLPLLDAVAAATDLPLIAAGGLMHGADIATVLGRGAVAAQLGTAFLCCPEAGTSDPHRRALLDRAFAETTITRAFTGRPARGLANRFAREHADAPLAYPEVHRMTQPLRAAGARAGDLDVLSLWAGTGWAAVTGESAGALVTRLAAEIAERP